VPGVQARTEEVGPEPGGQGGVMKDDRKTLEIEGPYVTCGACRFSSSLRGAFTVEDGLLVWRAHPDAQPSRGPDFTSCCEGRECPDEFTRITAGWGDREFSSEEIAALRAAAEYARLHEFDEEGLAHDQEG
jgi:hypothetical protein